MKPICYNGINKVIDLLNNGFKLDDIIDSYGRPIHSDATEFFSYHKQVKRLIIKKAYLDLTYRYNLYENFKIVN
tara:strand:- start:523 stop:744 length:222 start_codon:yes stop_codon:yes gene_type:complete